MRRRTRLLLLAATVGLVAPVAVSATSASAVDQDLQVSVTSGAPGTEITLSSASCDPQTSDEEELRLLTARLISGTAPDEVMAGAATGFDGHDPVLVIPDWIDPTDPAVIEASCIEVIWDPATDDVVQTITEFDPVAFDVEAGAGAPVQTRTFSRTSLLVGQAFSVAGTGCFLDDASYGGVDVVAGDDPSGRTMGEFITSGGGELDGQDFEAFAALTTGGISISGTQNSDGEQTIEVEEESFPLPEGPATAISYCGDDDGTLLLYEPQLLDISGTAPVDDIDLVVAPNTADATLAGGSCTQGTVDAQLDAIEADDFFGEELPLDGSEAGSAAIRGEAPASLVAGVRAEHGAAAVDSSTASRRHGRAARGAAKALADDGWVFETLTPDADGAWSLSDSAGFELGWVEAWTTCGDPLTDGFIYNLQAAAVNVSEPVPTSTTTTTTAVPPAPANAIPGTPSYAG